MALGLPIRPRPPFPTQVTAPPGEAPGYMNRMENASLPGAGRE